MKIFTWVNIKEAIPSPYQYCLVCGEKEGAEPWPISIGRHNGIEWELLVNGENNAIACGDLTWSIDADEITHWMDIPNAPKP